MKQPNEKPPKGKKIIPLEIPADIHIIYSNIVRITHSPSEFVFDFARLLPGSAHALVLSRTIMSPLSAKLLHRALSDNLAKYEANFGEIKIPGDSSLADYLFRKPTPPKE